MPTYAYACACGHSYEEDRSIHKDGPKRCPACKRADGDGFGQDFSQSSNNFIVRGQPTTIGQQAELNAKRLGKEQTRMLAEKGSLRPAFTGKLPENAKVNTTGTGERPWFREDLGPNAPALDKPLDTSKIPDLQKYIEG